MITRKLRIGGLAVLSLSVASVAFAAVAIDTEGVGFVGKGDVQLALDYNNAQLQSSAGSLKFVYSESEEYDVPCKKETRRQTNRNTFTRTSSVKSSVAYDGRKNKAGQITGFNLNGFDVTETTGSKSCPEGWEADGEPILVSDPLAASGVLTVNGVALTISE